MPYIITKTTCPNDKVQDEIKTFYMSKEKFPSNNDLMTEVVPSISKATNEGITSFRIFEVKEGKLESALRRNISMMDMFNHIPGLRYDTDVYYSSDELIKMLGFAPS